MSIKSDNFREAVTAAEEARTIAEGSSDYVTTNMTVPGGLDMQGVANQLAVLNQMLNTILIKLSDYETELDNPPDA